MDDTSRLTERAELWLYVIGFVGLAAVMVAVAPARLVYDERVCFPNIALLLPSLVFVAWDGLTPPPVSAIHGGVNPHCALRFRQSIIATCAKSTAQFSSRYVVQAAPFLVCMVAAPSAGTVGRLLRLLLGAAMGLASLLSCYR